MTVEEAEDLFEQVLGDVYDKDEIKNLCYYAIEHISSLKRSILLAGKSGSLSEQEETSLLIILDELKTGKPIQYILGETEFYGLKLLVNSSVLIPRPETEELVDWVLQEVKSKRLSPEDSNTNIKNPIEVGEQMREKPSRGVFRILDIGTGSGCIAIALKKHLPEAEIFGLDISAGALETALRNSILNDAEIKFVQGNILDPARNFLTIDSLSFNLVISNPPYITEKEKNLMHLNVLAHEPDIALFIPDNDPLMFYRRIADFAKENLRYAGLLFFEINESYGNEIVAMLTQKGFVNVELRRDMQGKDRMVKASR